MNFSGKDIVRLLFLTAVFFGCSTKRNTPVSRAYHNLTSHYNIYFNARQSLQSGLQRIDKTVQDDYTRILPIYKTSLPEAGRTAVSQMDLAILKSSKLITNHSITRKPKRKSNKSERYKKFASKGEYNRWVDDSYLLMGKANFFNHNYLEAEGNFNYVINNFPDNSIHYKARLWLARTYSEMGMNDKVQEIFNFLDKDKRFPHQLSKELRVAQADYYLKNSELTEAISRLQKMVKSGLPKKNKLRYHYILAQLYAATQKPQEALQEFRIVMKMKPPYQMDFNARISALELSSEDEQKTADQIDKLLKDENNLEFLDRIYYARGVINLRANRKTEALKDFTLSVRNSVSNNHQRVLSSLSAAQILFENENYLLSSCYYDSAMAVIENTYPDYQKIKTRAANLKRLAINLNTISREDSLQKLASMTDVKRNEIINQIITALQEAERQASNANIAAASDQNYFRSQQYRPQIRINDNQNDWYFYNPTTIGLGKSEFQRIWGKRKLEDNWRRKNKIAVNPDEMEQLAEEVTQIQSEEKKKKTDPKTLEYYLQDVPLTDSLRKISTEKIKLAFYNSGKIYQVDLKDYRKAINAFEELNRRFPASIYELPSWFELYQINAQLPDPKQAAYYKDKIIKSYPDSRYASFLVNPGFLEQYKTKQSAMEEKYAEVLKFYEAGDLANAKKSATETLLMNPDSSLLPKVKFIELVSDTAMADSLLDISLEKYISQYPRASTAGLARQVRNLLKTKALSDYRQLIKKGYIQEKPIIELIKKDVQLPPDQAAPVEVLPKEKIPVQTELKGKNIQTESPKTPSFPPLESYNGPYQTTVTGKNLYAFVFQTGEADTTLLKENFKSYNKQNPVGSALNISIKPLDDFRSILTMSAFPDLASALVWFKKLNDTVVFPGSLKTLNYRHFVITPANLEILKKEKNLVPYLEFFKKINNGQ